eukprot:22644_3
MYIYIYIHTYIHILYCAQLLGEFFVANEFRMATKNVPRWYPPGKYEYQGKNVLKITYGTKLQRGATNHFGTVHYTDGTAEDTDILTAKKAAAAFGFTVHQCYGFSEQPVIAEHYEAVPIEDPDEWEGGWWSIQSHAHTPKTTHSI